MLDPIFNPNQPYKVGIYVRMSDKNQRSLDHQIAACKLAIKRLKQTRTIFDLPASAIVVDIWREQQAEGEN